MFNCMECRQLNCSVIINPSRVVKMMLLLKFGG